MDAVSSGDVRAYYASALAALRFVESRRATGRRFGEEADARWAGFHGDLTTSDRIDLLIRDADAEWPGAFGARVVFDERAAAEDNAFGPAWSPMPPVEAEDLWREICSAPMPATIDALIHTWTRAWEVALQPFDCGAITGVERYVLAGPSAIVAMLRAFNGRTDVSWSTHVAIVATPPSHRQLAALGDALVHTMGRVSIFNATTVGALMGRAVVSDDAMGEDAAAAGKAVG